MLVSPPDYLNYEVIQEFYVNVLPANEEKITFRAMVRGRTICFDQNAINEYLGDLITLWDGELCAYARHLNHGSWNTLSLFCWKERVFSLMLPRSPSYF